MSTKKCFIINHNNTIREALVALNNVSGENQSLFVVNDALQMVGSLSDGDIRRGIINGGNLEDKVETIMHRDFKFLYKKEYDVAHLKAFRESRILFIPILDEQKHIVDSVNMLYMKSQLPVDAVLMAGGKGERLRPLTEKTPKPLLPIGDKAIIDHNIDHLISYGVKHINVTVNYLKEQIEEHFAEPYNGIQVRTFQEPFFLGTMGSVKFVDSFVNDMVLVMNSDLLTNIDYEDFYLDFLNNDADMSVAAVPYAVNVPYGIFELNGCDIHGLKEKPTYNYYANAGIYLIKRKLLNLIPAEKFFDATDFIEMLISNNYKVIRFPLVGYWIDIGKPEDYQKAIELVKIL